MHQRTTESTRPDVVVSVQVLIVEIISRLVQVCRAVAAPEGMRRRSTAHLRVTERSLPRISANGWFERGKEETEIEKGETNRRNPEKNILAPCSSHQTSDGTQESLLN